MPLINWNEPDEPKKKYGFINWNDDSNGLIDWNNDEEEDHPSFSLTERVLGAASTGLLGLGGEALSAITGDERYRNIAPAYAKRGADSIGGFTVGLVDALTDGSLSGLPDNVSTIEESAKMIDSLTKYTPGRIAKAALKQVTGIDTDIEGQALKNVAKGINQKMGWKDRQELGYTTVREEMLQKAQDDIDYASRNAQGIVGDIASDLGVDDKYIDPLKQVVNQNMQMADTAVMVGAPILAGMRTSSLAANVGFGNTGRMIAALGEGVAQGIGDNPQAPLAGAGLSATLTGIGAGIPMQIEKNALKANVARLRGSIEANSGRGGVISLLDDEVMDAPLIVRPIEQPSGSELIDGHDSIITYLGKDTYSKFINADDDLIKAHFSNIDPTVDWNKLSKHDAINLFGNKLASEQYNLNRLNAQKIQLDEFGQTTFVDNQTGSFASITMSDSAREAITHEGAPEGPLIILDSLKSNGSGTRGGTRALKQVQAYADELQVPVALRAVPFGDPNPANIEKNKIKLFNFYEQNGFKKVDSESGDLFVYHPEVVIDADDPKFGEYVTRANKYGAKVKINAAGPTARQIEENQVGSIPWLDARIAELESLQTPPKYQSDVDKHLADYELARTKVENPGKVAVFAHKLKSMWKSEDSIGGFRHNVSFGLAKKSVKSKPAQTFVDSVLKEEVNRQPGIGAALAQSYIDDVVPLEILIARKSKETGIGYQELNEAIGKAVRMKRIDTIEDPEIAQAVDKMMGGMERLRDTFIRNGLQREKAEAIIYRAKSYLTRSYINAEPNDVIDGLVRHDPEAYAKVIEWQKRKIRENISEDDLLEAEKAGVDIEQFITDKAVGQLQRTIKPEIPTGASAGKKPALGTTNEDVFETTQGAIEKEWTAFQKEALETLRGKVDPHTLPYVYASEEGPAIARIRLEIDSTFDTFLEKVGDAEARRIKARFVKYAADDLGLHVPPGEKVDYMSIRRALSEERKEFLFREAIRQEDMPDFLAKALGAKMGFSDALRETIVRVTHNNSVTNMLAKIRDEGIASGIISPVGQMDGWEELHAASRLGILGEYKALYAPKYIAAVINQSVDTADAVSALYTLNTRMKAGKVLSQAQTAVNFMSGGWSAILQGDLSPLSIGRGVRGELSTSAKAAIKSILAGDSKLSSKLMANPKIAEEAMSFFGVPRAQLYSGQFKDVFIDMMKRGVVGGGSGAEIEQILKLRQAEGYGLNTGLEKADEFISTMSRYYQSPDIFWKTFGYQNRVKDLMMAEFGLDRAALRELDLSKVPEEIKDRAARLVTDSYQSYNKTPNFFRNLSKNPLGPSFITYPVEALRNNKNIVLESMEYARDAIDAFNGKDLAKAGRYARLAIGKSITFWGGMAALYYTVQHGIGGMGGADDWGLDEKKKALIDEVVQFKGQKGNPMFVTGYDPETHQLQFIDLGNMNPFPHIAKLARVLDKDTGQTLPERMNELISEVSAIYSPMGILPRALAETATGRSVRSWFDTNGASYVDNPNAPGAIGYGTRGEQQGRKLYRAYRSMAPSILTQSEHVLRGIADEPLGSRKFSLGGETMYQLTGIRPNDVNLGEAYFYALRNTADTFKSLNINYRNDMRSTPESNQKALAEIRKTKQAELEKVMMEGIHYVESMRTLDFSEKDIKQMLKKMNYGSAAAVMNNKIIEALMKGDSGISITEVWDYD